MFFWQFTHSLNPLLKITSFLKKKLRKVSYKLIAKQKLHSEEISNHVAIIAKNKKVREIVNQLQMKIIRKNSRICVEGRDIASKILAKKFRQSI